MSGKGQWAIVAGIVAAAAVAVVVATRVLGGDLAQVAAGSKAPDFHAVPVALATAHGSLDARPKSLADYKGQVVLLNIWATWCIPCRSEMPSIERLQQEMGPQGLKIVAVSIDNPGMEQAIRDFAKELGLHFEILYDASSKIRDDYQSNGVPETFLIGKDGVIRKRVIAATDWSAEPEKALIRQLLAESAQ
ncbi:MAG: TlpA family protein disulfide reductase [Gemmatimonadales bacterium]